MLIRCVVVITLVLSLVLAGCAGKSTDRTFLAGQVDVFGVELLSDIDYRQIRGVTATEEPCLKGYERSFDALDVIIGYGFDRKIRKIMTRNPQTGMFGIRPGMPFVEGQRKILKVGFREHTPPFLYQTNGFTFKFLVDDTGTIFGVLLEKQ
jgi:hypothetical protein